MALLLLEEDPWLLEYDSCEKLYRDIMGQLSLRQKYSRTSDKYAEISANIRLRLKQFNNEVGQLNRKLEVTATTSAITPAESERRTRQVEFLLSKGIQMQKLFDEQVWNKMNEDRSQLIGRAGTSYGLPEGDSAVSVQNVQLKHKEILEEQEKGLENLSKIVSRHKNIASNISTEIDYHNVILDDVGVHVDRADRNVREATENVDKVLVKENTCAYWIIIILLFISIIVVAVI